MWNLSLLYFAFPDKGSVRFSTIGCRIKSDKDWKFKIWAWSSTVLSEIELKSFAVDGASFWQHGEADKSDEKIKIAKNIIKKILHVKN